MTRRRYYALLVATEHEYTARFVEKFTVSNEGCWHWTAARTPKGYGHFQYHGRVEYAHRAAYLMFVGPIPDGLEIDHVCHNNSECDEGRACLHRSCVNPAHLEAVTAGENARRGKGAAGVNSRKSICKNGHPFTAENTRPRADGTGRSCRACERERTLRERARFAAGASITHGTLSGYLRFRCSCEECLAARNKYMRAWRARKAAAS